VTDVLYSFVSESNKIEGIRRRPRPAEVRALRIFTELREVTALDVRQLVSVFQPGAVLRDRVGVNVRVGDHAAPPGGPEITLKLDDLLRRVNSLEDPYSLHAEYEILHPFTDCNGRSGRAIWAWQMIQTRGVGALDRGFLHEWYYQSLAAWDGRRSG
jgi:hypothetical protein